MTKKLSKRMQRTLLNKANGRTDGYYDLLEKYNGDLANATPKELELARKKHKNPQEALNARKEAIQRYEETYDKNGGYRFDLKQRYRSFGRKKTTSKTL